ncbi:MAG: heme exporter protein CcmD [Bradyrhizobiaceae bacterium]|nr:heme exporter protein CcmD [Bradyrhizobiaceae bacterium]
MELGQHAGFIVAAYVAALIVLALLVVWVIVDHRMQRQAIAKLEAQGITRRSARPGVEDVG